MPYFKDREKNLPKLYIYIVYIRTKYSMLISRNLLKRNQSFLI